MQQGPLLEQLYSLYPSLSKKKIKGYLKAGCVYINGKQVTQYNFLVSRNSTVEIRKQNKTHKRSPLPILFEDHDFLVIDKPTGLLSVGTDKEKEKTAYHKMRVFVNQRGRNEKLFVLHRLDKETSGVLAFVKNEKLKFLLQNHWDQLVTKREYIAIVCGHAKKDDTICLFLEEGKDLKMHVTSPQKGKKCITKYQCLEQNEQYSLLQIHITTGRKNQIRASLAFVGLPIVGDVKYGKVSKEKRLYLHASCLSIEHPLTHKRYTFLSKPPASFKEFF